MPDPANPTSAEPAQDGGRAAHPPTATAPPTAGIRVPIACDTTLAAGTAQPPDQPEPETLIADRYELTEELAKGGMGIIYRAIDKRFSRDVAVKLVREEFAAQPAIKRRFVEEARITGQLQHPAIPAVHDLGERPDGTPYLVMKLIKGETLQALLADLRGTPGSGSTATLGMLIGIFEKVCEAIGYAHSRGVIHRDLKPVNIMVGAFGEVQVMDWGLAKLVSRDARRSADSAQADSAAPPATTFQDPRADSDGSATQPGAVLGTPAYMPPEQAAGVGEEVDVQSDVFGLGAILCQILTGKPPHVGTRPEAIRFQAARGDLSEAHARLDACGAGPDLIALAKRCLAPKKAERPKDGSEVAAAVALIRSQAEQRARQAEKDQAEALVRIHELRKRRKLWLGLAATLLAGLLASSGLAWWANQVRSQEAEARQLAQENEGIARTNEAISKAVHQFLESRIFEAAQPEGQEGGLGSEVKLKEALRAALPYLESDFKDQPLIEAHLRNTLGISFLRLGELPVAEAQWRRARELFAAHRGADHPDTLRAMHNLAHACADQGRHTEALELRKQTAALMKRRLGPDHPDTLTALHNLSASYGDLGQHDQALQLCQESFELIKGKHGPDHPETISAMNNLATCYLNLGRPAEAEPLHQRVVDFRSRTLGADHPDTLGALHNLALANVAANKLTRGVRLFEQVLAARTKKLGADHPDTLMTLHNLARAYQDAGKLPEAIAAYEKVRAALVAKLGADHPSALLTYAALATAYRSAGRLSDALPLLEQAAAGVAKRQFSDRFAGQVMTDTIAAHEEAKDLARAEAWQRKWLAVVKTQTAADSTEYADELVALSSLLLQQKKWSDAEATARDGLAIRQKNQADCWRTFATQSLLGAALLGQRKYTEAEPLLLKGYKGMKQRADQMPSQAKDPRLREALERLVQLYEATGKPEEAAKWKKELQARQSN
jgi:serine/threonine protein kinase